MRLRTPPSERPRWSAQRQTLWSNSSAPILTGPLPQYQCAVLKPALQKLLHLPHLCSLLAYFSGVLACVSQEAAEIHQFWSIQLQPFSRCTTGRGCADNRCQIGTPAEIAVPTMLARMVQRDLLPRLRIGRVGGDVFMVVAPLARRRQIGQLVQAAGGSGRDVLDTRRIRFRAPADAPSGHAQVSSPYGAPRFTQRRRAAKGNRDNSPSSRCHATKSRKDAAKNDP